MIWKLRGCVFRSDIILSLHDLSCQPEDVQNYIDRSLLLTHGFVPIIEAIHLQQGHDERELMMIIEMLLDVICTYVYMLCLEDLLFIHTVLCVFVAFALTLFHLCVFSCIFPHLSIQYSIFKQFLNPLKPICGNHDSASFTGYILKPDIFWHRCAEHLSLSWWQQRSFVWISVGVLAFWWIRAFSFAQQQTNAKVGEQGTHQSSMVELSFKHSHSYFNYHTLPMNLLLLWSKKHLKSRDYDDCGNVFAGSCSFVEHWFCRLAHSLHLGLGRVKERILHSLRMPCQVKEHGPLKVEISLLDCYLKRPLCRSWFAEVNILRKSNLSFTSICKIHVTQEAVGGGGAVKNDSSTNDAIKTCI